MIDRDTAIEKLEMARTFANVEGEPDADANDDTRYFLIAKNTNGIDYDFKKVAFKSHVHTALQGNILEKVGEAVNGIESNKRILKPYDISNSGRDELIQYMETEELEEFDRFSDIIEKEEFSEANLDYTNDNSQIDFQAMKIVGEDPETTVIVFQHYRSEQVVSKSWMLRLIKKEGEEYNTVEDEGQIWAVPEKIDALYVDGIIFSFNSYNFEKIFDHLDTYRKQAEAVFNEMEDSGISIHEFDDFYSSIKNDGNALRKMQEIEETGLYKQLNQKDVEHIIDEYNLNLETKINNGEWGIEVGNYQNKWEVIRLLNDDHLQSALTEKKYRVYGKSPNSE